MIIDFHVHCFPDNLTKHALRKLSQTANGLPFYTNGTVGGLKKSMRAAGIDYSIVQHIATKPSQTPAVNRWAVSINHGKVISFGTIHPDYPRWKEEIRFLSDAKIKGVKFHPDYQDFRVDDRRLYPIYEALAKAGIPVLFHAGLDLGYPAPYKCMPEDLAKVLGDFPGWTVIAAHMGAYDYWEDVEKYLLGKNVYFDTSYCLHGMEPARLCGLIRSHGVEKVLFGTDSPWDDQSAELTRMRALDLSETEMAAVLGNNAGRLLGMDA